MDILAQLNKQLAIQLRNEFDKKKDKNDDHSFESDLYNLIYEIIIADHEISEQEIIFASEDRLRSYHVNTSNNIKLSEEHAESTCFFIMLACKHLGRRILKSTYYYYYACL